MKKFIDTTDLKDYIKTPKFFVKKKKCNAWKVAGIAVAVIAVIALIVAIVKFAKREEYLYGDDYDDDFEDDDVIFAQESDFDQ